MNKKCIDCRFWLVFPVDEDASFKRGTCRRFPPVIDPIAVNEEIVFYKENGKEAPDTDSHDPTVWTQPTTWQDEWCGEYQPMRCNAMYTAKPAI